MSFCNDVLVSICTCDVNPMQLIIFIASAGLQQVQLSGPAESDKYNCSGIPHLVNCLIFFFFITFFKKFPCECMKPPWFGLECKSL